MLEVNGLKAGYGYNLVLDGISVNVQQGEIVTIVGANGAGKSTFLKAVSGVIRRKGGEVLFEGKPLPQKPSAVVKEGLIQCPEGRQVFSSLTVKSNLIMGGYRLKKAREEQNMKTVFSLFPVLEERQNQLAGTLSGGEQQMLAIARAMMAEPKLLLLDEPSLGLAPIYIDAIFSFLEKINREQGLTILLVEQNAKKAFGIADRAYVLEDGRIVKHGPAKQIAGDPDVAAAYLGGTQKK